MSELNIFQIYNVKGSQSRLFSQTRRPSLGKIIAIDRSYRKLRTKRDRGKHVSLKRCTVAVGDWGNI